MSRPYLRVWRLSRFAALLNGCVYAVVQGMFGMLLLMGLTEEYGKIIWLPAGLAIMLYGAAMYYTLGSMYEATATLRRPNRCLQAYYASCYRIYGGNIQKAQSICKREFIATIISMVCAVPFLISLLIIEQDIAGHFWTRSISILTTAWIISCQWQIHVLWSDLKTPEPEFWETSIAFEKDHGQVKPAKTK